MYTKYTFISDNESPEGQTCFKFCNVGFSSFDEVPGAQSVVLPQRECHLP